MIGLPTPVGPNVELWGSEGPHFTESERIPLSLNLAQIICDSASARNLILTARQEYAVTYRLFLCVIFSKRLQADVMTLYQLALFNFDIKVIRSWLLWLAYVEVLQQFSHGRGHSSGVVIIIRSMASGIDIYWLFWISKIVIKITHSIYDSMNLFILLSMFSVSMQQGCCCLHNLPGKFRFDVLNLATSTNLAAIDAVQAVMGPSGKVSHCDRRQHKVQLVAQCNVENWP